MYIHAFISSGNYRDILICEILINMKGGTLSKTMNKLNLIYILHICMKLKILKIVCLQK